MPEPTLAALAPWWRETIATVLAGLLGFVGVSQRTTSTRLVELEKYSVGRAEMNTEVAKATAAMTSHVNTRLDNTDSHLRSVHEDVKTLINRELSK